MIFSYRNKIQKTFFVIFTVALLAGCANRNIYYSKPSPQAELFNVASIVTPTRVVVETSNFKAYVVDLAYFYPSTLECQNLPEACAELRDKVLDKKVWIEREYDRFGLPMHTLWVADLPYKPLQPINIQLIVDGGYARLTDFRNLPNGKSELVSRSYDLAINKYRQSTSYEGKAYWQQRMYNGIIK